jgi:hypothetical protein
MAKTVFGIPGVNTKKQENSPATTKESSNLKAENAAPGPSVSGKTQAISAQKPLPSQNTGKSAPATEKAPMAKSAPMAKVVTKSKQQTAPSSGGGNKTVFGMPAMDMSAIKKEVANLKKESAKTSNQTTKSTALKSGTVLGTPAANLSSDASQPEKDDSATSATEPAAFVAPDVADEKAEPLATTTPVSSPMPADNSDDTPAAENKGPSTTLIVGLVAAALIMMGAIIFAVWFLFFKTPSDDLTKTPDATSAAEQSGGNAKPLPAAEKKK